MNRTYFQSPLEAIFETGGWGSLKIHNTDHSTRKALVPVFDEHNIKNWDPTSDKSIKSYGLLYDFLKSDQNDRFLLYCPFEILPDISLYRNVHVNIDNFLEAYIRAWTNLLDHYDVAANFTNGDIPDFNDPTRTPDRIQQCAWLVKPMREKGLLTVYDMHLLTMNPVLADSLKSVESYVEQPWPNVTINYDNITKSISDHLIDKNDYSGMSYGRKKWLQSEFKSRKIKEFARNLDLDKIDIRDICWSIELVVATIDHQFFTALKSDPQKAYDLFEKYYNLLDNFQYSDAVQSFLNRVYNSACLNTRILEHVDLSKNTYPTWVCSKINSCMNRINILEELICPVMILYGSRIKGYAQSSSDYDIAVIVKDGINDFGVIDQYFDQKVLKYKTRFNEITRTHDLVDAESRDPSVGSFNDAHVLLNGIWIGDNDHVHYLGETFLKPIVANHSSRHRWELEKDLLQYRLLHRGYERFNYVENGPVFMNTGYRCLASKLYLSKVFDITC